MSRIRTNTLALTTAFFVTAVLYFVQLKILTNFMSREMVGAWTAVTSVAMLLVPFAELGMPQVLVRYAAKYDAERRLARLRRLFHLGLWIYAAGLLAVCALRAAVGPAVGRLLGGEVIGRGLLLLGFLAVATGSLRALNNACLRGLRKMPVMAMLEIGFGILVTLGYFVFRHQLSVGAAFQIFGVASLTVAVVGLTYQHRLFRSYATDPHDKEPVFKEVQHFWQGAASAGVFLIAIEHLYIPLLAAGLICLAQLAVFLIASRLALFPPRLDYVPFQVMYPEVTHKWEGPRRHELARDMELFTKLILGLGLVMSVFLSVFAKPLMVLAANEEYLSGAPILWMFMAVLPIMSLHQPLVMFLRATGSVWYAFAAEAMWLGLYLGVGSVLLRWFGLPGFVGGQLVSSTAVLIYTLALLPRLNMPRPPVAFYVKRALLSLVVWGAAMALGRLWPYGAVWQLALLGLGLALLGNFLVVRGGFLSAEEEERTIAMFAGRGRVGQIMTFLVRWPRFGAPRHAA